MELNWRKATKSAQADACVEVARLDPGTVAVRDSKDSGGAILRFTQSEWDAFLDGMAKREFNDI